MMKKKLSKQCWGSDLIIYIPCCWLFQHFKPSDEIPDWQSDMIMCEIFIHLVIAVLVNQFQFFFSLLKKIFLSLFPSFKLKIYPSLDVKPQEVNLMHIQLIKLKSGFGFFCLLSIFLIIHVKILSVLQAKFAYIFNVELVIFFINALCYDIDLHKI